MPFLIFCHFNVIRKVLHVFKLCTGGLNQTKVQLDKVHSVDTHEVHLSTIKYIKSAKQSFGYISSCVTHSVCYVCITVAAYYIYIIINWKYRLLHTLVTW